MTNYYYGSIMGVLFAFFLLYFQASHSVFLASHFKKDVAAFLCPYIPLHTGTIPHILTGSSIKKVISSRTDASLSHFNLRWK